MTGRLNFPLTIKKQRLAHATGDDGVIRCEGCGKPVKRGQYQFDHHLAAWLKGKPTFDNCRLLCKKCHDPKSALDKKLSAKSDRVQAKEIGAATQPKRPIQSRGFPPTGKPKLEKLPLPSRRPGYFGCFKIEE